MNRLTTLLFLVFHILIITSSSAQECTSYFPSQEGTILQLKIYSPAGKVLYTVEDRVVKTLSSDRKAEVNIEREINKKKTKMLVGYQTLVFRCEGDKTLIDMASLLTPKQVKYMYSLGATVEVSNGYLDIPAKIVPGEIIGNDRHLVTLILQTHYNKERIGMETTVSGRKIDGTETITTPAGTFECIKIRYFIEGRGLGKYRQKRVEEWHAKGLGIVQSRSYDKKVKLLNYTHLTAIKQPASN